MATTGVRVGEALDLRRDDLELEARRLRVNRTIHRGGVSQPKTQWQAHHQAFQAGYRSTHAAPSYQRTIIRYQQGHRHQPK
jgi:integrase